MEYEYLTYEWRKNRVVVHGWSRYPVHSVLAGQPMKCFLAFFDTQEEAEQAYPKATASPSRMQAQNTFDHLPDDEI